MDEGLNILAFSDCVDNFEVRILMSALALFYSFVDEQTQKEANGVGCQPDDSVGLVVDCELFGHIEQFIRFKHDILTIEHSKGKDNGDKHRNCE